MIASRSGRSGRRGRGRSSSASSGLGRLQPPYSHVGNSPGRSPIAFCQRTSSYPPKHRKDVTVSRLAILLEECKLFKHPYLRFFSKRLHVTLFSPRIRNTEPFTTDQLSSESVGSSVRYTIPGSTMFATTLTYTLTELGGMDACIYWQSTYRIQEPPH